MKIDQTDRIFGCLALLGLVISMTFHLLTFTYFSIRKFVPYATELLTIAFFILAVFMFRSAKRRYCKNDAVSDFLAAIPTLARYLFVALVIYAFIDKIVYFIFLDDGMPVLVNGKYMLKDHQWRMHPLTEEEFYIRKDYISRTGYATLMPAYAGLVAYFFAYR